MQGWVWENLLKRVQRKRGGDREGNMMTSIFSFSFFGKVIHLDYETRKMDQGHGNFR